MLQSAALSKEDVREGAYHELRDIATEVLNNKEKTMEEFLPYDIALINNLAKLGESDFSAVISKATKIRREAALKSHIGRVYKKEMFDNSVYFFVPSKITSEGDLQGNEGFTENKSLVVQEVRIIIEDIPSWTLVIEHELASKILAVVNNDVSLKEVLDV